MLFALKKATNTGSGPKSRTLIWLKPFYQGTRWKETGTMRKLFFIMSILLFMLLLIGTASADWFKTTISSSPLLPEYAALIVLGGMMVALGAYGRRNLSPKNRQD
jgi:phosphoglycerol transferase MdoB-like AlkP superfamily enzyme